jgi:hypothetical protein
MSSKRNKSAIADAAFYTTVLLLVVLPATVVLIFLVGILKFVAVDSGPTLVAGFDVPDARTGGFDFKAIPAWPPASADLSGDFRDTEPFLLGLYTPDAKVGYPVNYWSAEHKLGAKFRVVALYQAWSPLSLTSFPIHAAETGLALWCDTIDHLGAMDQHVS